MAISWHQQLDEGQMTPTMAGGSICVTVLPYISWEYKIQNFAKFCHQHQQQTPATYGTKGNSKGL